MEHLERHRPIVLQVPGEENRGHAAPPELALERIATAQPCLQLRAEIGHGGGVRGVGSRYNSRTWANPGEGTKPRVRIAAIPAEGGRDPQSAGREGSRVG